MLHAPPLPPPPFPPHNHKPQTTKQSIKHSNRSTRVRASLCRLAALPPSAFLLPPSTHQCHHPLHSYPPSITKPLTARTERSAADPRPKPSRGYCSPTRNKDSSATVTVVMLDRVRCCTVVLQYSSLAIPPRTAVLLTVPFLSAGRACAVHASRYVQGRTGTCTVLCLRSIKPPSII